MKKIISFSIVMLLLLPLTASASTGSKPSFSADIYYQSAGGKTRKVMRAHFSKNKLRIERIHGGVGIVRYDKDVVWALNKKRRVVNP